MPAYTKGLLMNLTKSQKQTVLVSLEQSLFAARSKLDDARGADTVKAVRVRFYEAWIMRYEELIPVFSTRDEVQVAQDDDETEEQ